MKSDELSAMSKVERMHWLADKAIEEMPSIEPLAQICRDVEGYVSHTWIHDIKPPLRQRLTPFNNIHATWMVLCYVGCECGCQDRLGASPKVRGLKTPALVADLTRIAVQSCVKLQDDEGISPQQLMNQLVESVTGRKGVKVTGFEVGNLSELLSKKNDIFDS